MKADILERPAYAAALVRLDPGEEVVAESGAMIAMSSGVDVETRATRRGGGGLLRGIKRMFAGEDFFLNRFTARRPGETLLLGPALPGDVLHHSLEMGSRGSLVVQGSSWLACDGGVEVDATWQGITSAFFSGEGLFWIKCSGRGDVLLNAFGAIYEVEVDGEHVVDGGHVVAFEDSLTFDVSKAGSGWISSFLAGEGLACRFRGKGRLWCQSHDPRAFGRSLTSLLLPIRT